LQFYDLANGASTVLLGEVPGRLEPIVRVIDMPQRLWDKALLFEARVGQGRLLVSGFRFEAALKASDRAALYFLDELVRYALGPDFRPAGTIPLEYFAARPHVEGK
jgi:beta-galactosidase